MSLVSINVRCPRCNDEGSIVVNYSAFRKWQDGTLLIQQAFPELSADDRERLISRQCKDCWKEIFSDD